MCLILIALHVRPDLPLVIAANRDEFYARPTAPAGRWPDAPEIIGGRDLREGGSWLGFTERGRWAAVTNFRESTPLLPGAPSRGHLVSNFLHGGQSPADYLADLAHRATRYNGFNLLVGDTETVLWYSNRGAGHPQLARPLAPGVYGLSNHLLDTPWPKVERGKRELEEVLVSADDPEAIMEVLLDRTLADEADLPRTGVPLDLERALSSLFISGVEYGTRCSTVIRTASNGDTVFVERSYQPPGEVSVVRHEFAIHL